MNLEKMTKEELETLSYTDLSEMIIKEEKKSLNTPTIFKRICELLELTDEDYQSQIGDFYTSLTTDKRFILLDNACWDLRDNHAIDIVLDEEDDEEPSEEDEEEVTEEDEETEEDIDIINDDIIEQDDDLDDLTILDEDELEE